ncbi:MAG TPA: hypothetical protein PK413_00410 [Thermoanaerobaculia bacterium]|nr:hypothetical protein [Thermoanaerobaculia bacterium]
MEPPRPLRTILLAGLAGGACDILAAFLVYGLRGANPVRILQSIASGLLGAESYQGGAATAALGLLLQFVIATGAAAVFYLASRRMSFLREKPILAGLAYGVAVWLFMQRVVLPLSAYPHKLTYTVTGVTIGIVIHMLCVGLPISLTVRRLSG